MQDDSGSERINLLAVLPVIFHCGCRSKNSSILAHKLSASRVFEKIGYTCREAISVNKSQYFRRMSRTRVDKHPMKTAAQIPLVKVDEFDVG